MRSVAAAVNDGPVLSQSQRFQLVVIAACCAVVFVVVAAIKLAEWLA
jgi:hypothetical protein